MSHDRKKKKQLASQNKSVKSITSLTSLNRSREDENSELDNIYDTVPKSVLSLKSLSSNPNCTKDKLKEKDIKEKKTDKSIKKKIKKQKKQIDELRDDESRSRKENFKKIEEISLKQNQNILSSKKNENIAKQRTEQKQDKPKDQFIKTLPRLYKNIILDPALSPLSRSNEPPPILGSRESSILTPSECKIYFDHEKDLVETTISKKYDQLKDDFKTPSPYLKIPFQKLKLNTFTPPDEIDQDSFNELENFIFSTEPDDKRDDDRFDRNQKDSTYDEIKVENKGQMTISQEITARYENLIMDNEIFEKALTASSYKEQPTNAFKDTPKAINPETKETQTNQLNLPILSENQINQTTDQITATTISSEPPILPKDQSDAVVLYSYKTKAKKDKKRKKKKKKLDLKIGFIGAGKMSEAIVHFLIYSLKFNPNKIFISSPSGRNLEQFKDKGN